LKLIFVHGINNEDKNSDVIVKEWSDALFAACQRHQLVLPENVIITAAFYGDILEQKTKSWNETTDQTTTMSASDSISNTVSEDHGAFYQEFQKYLGISDTQLRQYLTESDQIAPMAAGIHKKWLKAIARAVEDILPTKGKYIARLFLKQAAAYLHAPGVKSEIDRIVKEQVFDGVKAGEKTVVVAHSLGSIISYDLLRKMHGSDVNFDLLLTAGSPLGIEIVKKRLGPPLFISLVVLVDSGGMSLETDHNLKQGILGIAN